jgi:hypothetical protein
MNGRPLTDARVSDALRAHLPQSAPAGLRELIVDAAESTTQQRALPSFLGALMEADPVARRRSMLIAAALLVALAIATAAAVGALRLLQRDPFDQLSLDPPADVPAFVLSSYERLPQLPPLALTWHDSDSAKGRIYVDRSGAVRFDRFTSAEAAEPASYRILSPDHRISGMAPVESEPVWVEQGEEAIGEDPRVFLRTVLSADEVPGCEMERDPTDVGNDTVAAGWRYVGLENVAGRPTHHVACAGDLWIDIETRLILRTQSPAVDDAGQPIPVEVTEVIEIAFGEQPAAIFEPPEGVTRMSAEDYSAYICARDLPNEMAPGISDCPPTDEAEATPLPEQSPAPMATERPNTNDCPVPPGDPSQQIGPLAWTPESQNEDWPAPVRPEPAGGGSVQPMPLMYLDPTGDNGPTGFPCVDIRWVTVDTGELHLKLDSSQPAVDPAEQWVAYGVVTDDDRDGVPDWRYGIDNVPFGAAEASGDPSPRRWWRTDLHTGRTHAGGMGGGDADWFGADFRSGYPRDSDDAVFWFGGASTSTPGRIPWGFELDMPFYTWASVIVNGRVLATDYAPETGWLVATRGVRPGGTFLLGDPFPNLSMTVPGGWTTIGSSPLNRVTCGVLGRHVGPDEYYRADCARVEFAVIGDPEERVWTNDLCEDTIEPPLGSSFDDLVTCIASRGVDGNPYGGPIIASEDVTVDGYRGKHFEYSPQTRSGGCPDDCGDVWIVDVNGVLLLIGSLPTGDLDGDVPKEAVKAEIRQMVESIHIER